MKQPLNHRRKMTFYTQGNESKHQTRQSFTKSINLRYSHTGREVQKSQKEYQHPNIGSNFPMPRSTKSRHEEALKAKQMEEEFHKYEVNLSRRKKQQAMSRLYLQKDQTLFKKKIQKLTKREKSPRCKNNLFIDEFSKFIYPNFSTCSQDWNRMLLKVNKIKQKEQRQDKQKKFQPYQKLINKLQTLNKQNFSYENINGINFCKGIKHQIQRASSHSNTRAKNQNKNNSLAITKNCQTRSHLKSAVIQPTLNIIQMCKQYSIQAKDLKMNMDGFQIYCSNFNNLLNKKKAALAAFESNIQ